MTCGKKKIHKERCLELNWQIFFSYPKVLITNGFVFNKLLFSLSLCLQEDKSNVCLSDLRFFVPSGSVPSRTVFGRFLRFFSTLPTFRSSVDRFLIVVAKGVSFRQFDGAIENDRIAQNSPHLPRRWLHFIGWQLGDALHQVFQFFPLYLPIPDLGPRNDSAESVLFFDCDGCRYSLSQEKTKFHNNRGFPRGEARDG